MAYNPFTNPFARFSSSSYGQAQQHPSWGSWAPQGGGFGGFRNALNWFNSNPNAGLQPQFTQNAPSSSYGPTASPVGNPPIGIPGAHQPPAVAPVSPPINPSPTTSPTTVPQSSSDLFFSPVSGLGRTVNGQWQRATPEERAARPMPQSPILSSGFNFRR